MYEWYRTNNCKDFLRGRHLYYLGKFGKDQLVFATFFFTSKFIFI